MLILFLIKFHGLIHRLLGTENEFIDTTDEEIVVDVAGETIDYVPRITNGNYPTWTGTDRVYWYNIWKRGRK